MNRSAKLKYLSAMQKTSSTLKVEYISAKDCARTDSSGNLVESE